MLNRNLTKIVSFSSAVLGLAPSLHKIRNNFSNPELVPIVSHIPAKQAAPPTWNGLLMVLQDHGDPSKMCNDELLDFKKEVDNYTSSLLNNFPKYDLCTSVNDRNIKSLRRFFSEVDGEIPGTMDLHKAWKASATAPHPTPLQDLRLSIYTAYAIREVHRSAWSVAGLRDNAKDLDPHHHYGSRDLDAEIKALENFAQIVRSQTKPTHCDEILARIDKSTGTALAERDNNPH